MSRMILGASYWVLIIQTSYSSYPRYVTALSLCCLCVSREVKLFSGGYFEQPEKPRIKAGQLHHSLKLDIVLQSRSVNPCSECVCLLVFNRPNPVLCLPGIDDRSGSSPWGPGQQNNSSFNQGRVRFILTYYIESGHIDVMLLSFSETQQKFGLPCNLYPFHTQTQCMTWDDNQHLTTDTAPVWS